MPTEYACLAAVDEDWARCRNNEGTCPNHDASSPRAPRPDRVLFKVNVNKHWLPFFQTALPTLQRSYEKAKLLEADRVMRAEKLRRDAYAARDKRDTQAEQQPEAADSGVPVFGKSGLADRAVDVRSLVAELKEAGYVMTFANLLHRDWKPPIRLQLEFSKAGTKAEFEGFHWGNFEALISTAFDQVDVWANDRDPKRDYMVIHTVNCGRRANQVMTRCKLHFAGGDWHATV